MGLLFKISLRNLIRQKRRNILLGIAIAFGTMVLIIAHGFSHGISDNLFNKVIVYVSGHIGVVFTEDGNMFKQICHDGPQVKEIVKKTIPDVVSVQEAVGMMSRAIGNGKSDNVIMVGMDLTGEVDEKSAREAEQNFKMIEGQFTDLSNDSIENPVILAKEKADYLNVKRGDVLRVRYRTVIGQNQTARLTVAGVFMPANAFMAAPVFLELSKLKKLVGYGKYDIGQLYLTIKEPKKNAVHYAESLQVAFKPSIAIIQGKSDTLPNGCAVTVLGFKNDTSSTKLLEEKLFAKQGASIGKETVIMSDSLALSLKKQIGDMVEVYYTTKYEKNRVRADFKITDIISYNGVIPQNCVIVNNESFIKAYNSNLPLQPDNSVAFLQDSSHALYKSLSPQWVLLPRAKSTTELEKRQRETGKNRIQGTAMDIRTMYESASAVLNLEYVLNLITFIAVMILFFIILIGVINTLRMTVKERTREIGTIRAIGMQKRDVWLSFVMETFFLSLFSAISGTILGFIAMWGMSLGKIDAKGDALGMLLVNERLYFVPTVGSVLFYIALIVFIAVATAYFPARKAANLSAAEALRHYE
ncbi:MAG TPA: FtsX-like permease family protein [Chitinispirillaceae bacterium]|nr:FtsX-like permease family protein [Chitinispirillaceae bacterium]